MERTVLPFTIFLLRAIKKSFFAGPYQYLTQGKYVHIYNFERCHSALNNQTPASCYYPILLLDDHVA